MIIYANITYRQTDKYINSIVQNLTKEMQINKLEIHDSYLATLFLVLNIFGLVSAPFVFRIEFQRSGRGWIWSFGEASVIGHNGTERKKSSRQLVDSF